MSGATIDSTPAGATASACRPSWSPTPAAGWLWPERPDNWRWEPGRRRRPSPRWRRRSRASEPVTVGVSDALSSAPGRRCRRRCGWSRSPPTTPGCATSARPSSSTATASGAGVDWRFNAWGGHDGGLYAPGTATTGRRQGARGRGRRALPGAARARGRLDPRRRRGHGVDHRRVPAEPQPQPGALARADRSAPARLPRRREGRSGSAPGWSRTRPTATSTTSPASRARASCC